jgi:hypothetical protein
VTGTFAVVVARSSVAVGRTTTVTVAVAGVPDRSTTVYSKVSVPEKPAAGVYVYVPVAPSSSSEPWPGVVCAVTLRPSPRSLPSSPVARSVVTAEPPAATLTVSATACGATWTVTVTVSEPEPSVTVYVKVSVPENPVAGVYVYEPSACTATVPWAGWVDPLTRTPWPRSSARRPGAAPTVGCPAVAVTVSAPAVGRTVTVTVAVVVVPEASVAE